MSVLIVPLDLIGHQNIISNVICPARFEFSFLTSLVQATIPEKGQPQDKDQRIKLVNPTLGILPGASLFLLDYSVSGIKSLQLQLGKATDDLVTVLLSTLIITSVNGKFFRLGIMCYSPVHLKHLAF